MDSETFSCDYRHIVRCYIGYTVPEDGLELAPTEREGLPRALMEGGNPERRS